MFDLSPQAFDIIDLSDTKDDGCQLVVLPHRSLT
jgi:hypothetical protein